jgi:putative ABC transport system permease protein
MVMRAPGLSPLNRKLLRDLIAMRGQAIAIALVIAAGVSMFVMYLSNFDSLERTTRAYYERQRFADVFASSKRAPLTLISRISAIPDVTFAEPRVVVNVTLDIPGFGEPATGRLISIPADRRPRLNDLFLREGRWIDPSRPDEVIASEAFCRAHGFMPGDRIGAIINGRRRWLTIVGLALSPEYIYSLRPGELIPDDRRFGIFWMAREPLASAFDMEGGFNDLVLDLAPRASVDEVIAQVDALLERYGGLGAVPRERQLSNWTIENEFAQLRSFGIAVPLIFLIVAAFVLNVALTRAVALQRPQIAALKAIGYDNTTLAWHYLKWALVIAAGGSLLGVVAGAWMGAAIIQIYNQYFRFPVLDYRLSSGVTIGAVGASLGAAALGAWAAVRRAVRIPPAEAMRPETPPRYRRSLIELPIFRRLLSTAARMVLRNLERQPVRAFTSVVGVAFAVAILLVGFTFTEAITRLIDVQFDIAQRQDVTLTFVEPRPASASHALTRLPGVLQVEPMRVVPARLRAGPRERTVTILGVPESPRLNRIVDMDGRVQALPPAGLVLSGTLARVLGIQPGETVQVEVLEGRRPHLLMPVTATVDDAMGLSAYMDIEMLHRTMHEGAVLSGAYLEVDPAALPSLHRQLKVTPAVAGVTLTAAARRNFRETMAENLNVTISINVIFASIIAFGVIYNGARISLAERSRELASLRVLGFTRAEISLILLGELAVVTLAAIPIGVAIGYGLCQWISYGFSSEVYRIPLVFSSRVAAWAALTTLAASAMSGLIVRRRLDRLDLVAVLKVRE